MAFYPDELSPIDRIRNLGKQTDSLPEIGSIKNRRQWKSLVLGKKDLGMNNFATIKEEKEEEISSDGSQGTSSNKDGALTMGAVIQKKITFPKPRKYITSRVSDRKDDLRHIDNTVPFTPPSSESSIPGSDGKKVEAALTSDGSKSTISETKQQLKPGKSKELIGVSPEFVQSYALNETPLEAQWKEVFSENLSLSNWSKPSVEKPAVSKQESAQGPKPKHEEKKKGNENARAVTATSPRKRESEGGKKKGGAIKKNIAKGKGETSSKIVAKPKSEKGKTLNMKEVVNVYKNLAYGSKQEIKNFVENLPFVKDESKAEMDKNMLSMMNLKVLENKIKHFAKNTDKNQEATTSSEKKPKPERVGRKNRKAHIERLARHKVVKVPAVLSKHRMKTVKDTGPPVKSPVPKEKKTSVKDREPWKYVGMESVLDKTYFVYPAYPPTVGLKNTTKNKKRCAKGVGKGNAGAPKVSKPEPKVKAPQVLVRPNTVFGGGSRSVGLNVSGSMSSKSINRPSAMTVCTVEFRPGLRHGAEEPPAAGPADQSLLVYLHGTKAIHVKSPYSGKQFSRVKLFRKDERGMPLIKGIGRGAAPKGCSGVSVRNISLPEKLTRVRSLDLLDFDADIQNITDFLRSQESPARERQEASQRAKKSERESWPKESTEEQDAPVSRRHRRQRRTAQQDLPPHLHLPHQHGTYQENLSPDSIMNEISKNIRHFQYLPDTEANRKMIGQFFDELDHQIEASKKGALAFRKFPPPPGPDTFRPIPILGY